MISKILVKSPPQRPATSASPHDAPLAAKRPRGRRLLWLAILAAVTAGGYFAVPRELLSRLLPTSAAERAAPPPPRAVPVVAATVRQGDMDLFLNGLGSVTALHSVTLRSRVDGELIKVAFREGQVVNKGDLLAEIDPRPYQVQMKQALGQLVRDEAAQKIAQLNLERYTALAPAKTITQQQVDEQEALVKQAQGTVDSDRAQVSNIELQLDYCRITAPVAGTIGLRLVDPGNMVKANDPNGMAVINQLEPITVVFTIPQDDVARVQKQLNAGHDLPVTAFDRDFKNQLATGKLVALDNQVDVTTGTVKLKALFPNDDHMLFPNQFVNARLLVETRHDAVMVPTAALQQGPTATYVYRVQTDSTVQLQNVTVGPIEGDQASIEEGLSPGDIVVIDGVDKLQQGTKVAVRDRSPAAAGGAKATPGSPASQGS